MKTFLFTKKTVIVNGTTYKRSGTDIVSFVNNLDDKSLKQLQELVDTNFNGEKVFFYNGLYYSITFKEGKLKKYQSFKEGIKNGTNSRNTRTNFGFCI